MPPDDRRDSLTRQIRDFSRIVQSPSLLEAGQEPAPDEIVRDLLVEEWFATEVTPRPLIYVPGGPDAPKQHDLKRQGDLILVQVMEQVEQFRGFRHEHVDIEIPVTLEVRTAESRRRMWNIVAEARRIWYKWILALRPYHSLFYDRFAPEYGGHYNYYSGMMHLRITADAMPVFRRSVTGMEVPANDPGTENEV